MPVKKLYRHYPLLIILALLIFHGINNYIWIRMDRGLPFDDQAFHLLAGLDCFEILSNPSWDIVGRLMNVVVEYFYPPFFHICMGFFNVLFGPSIIASKMAHIPFFILLFSLSML